VVRQNCGGAGGSGRGAEGVASPRFSQGTRDGGRPDPHRPCFTSSHLTSCHTLPLHRGQDRHLQFRRKSRGTACHRFGRILISFVFRWAHDQLPADRIAGDRKQRGKYLCWTASRSSSCGGRETASRSGAAAYRGPVLSPATSTTVDVDGSSVTSRSIRVSPRTTRKHPPPAGSGAIAAGQSLKAAAKRKQRRGLIRSLPLDSAQVTGFRKSRDLPAGRAPGPESFEWGIGGGFRRQGRPGCKPLDQSCQPCPPVQKVGRLGACAVGQGRVR
jgi:hypothetical protein